MGAAPWPQHPPGSAVDRGGMTVLFIASNADRLILAVRVSSDGGWIMIDPRADSVVLPSDRTLL